MGLSTIVLAVMLASPGPSLQDDGDVETGAAARASGADAQAAASSPPVPSGSGTAPPVEHAPADATPAPPAEASAEATNDIIVHANPRHVRADPMSGINAATFDVCDRETRGARILGKQPWISPHLPASIPPNPMTVTT